MNGRMNRQTVITIIRQTLMYIQRRERKTIDSITFSFISPMVILTNDDRVFQLMRNENRYIVTIHRRACIYPTSIKDEATITTFRIVSRIPQVHTHSFHAIEASSYSVITGWIFFFFFLSCSSILITFILREMRKVVESPDDSLWKIEYGNYTIILLFYFIYFHWREQNLPLGKLL